MSRTTKKTTHLISYSGLLVTAALIGVVGCSSRPAPAPVIEIYQGKSYLDFEKDAFADKKYIVKKGDTLFAIAWFTGNDYRDLARINKISKPYAIYPGQEILLKKTAPAQTARSENSPGRTTKNKANQTVDRPKKQAYGEPKNDVKRPVEGSNNSEFPDRVTRWIWPADGKIIGNFSNQELGNKGIDISGKRGDRIVAAASGKVVYTGNALRGYGRLVIVKHSESFLSAYAHNENILVTEQQWVKAGQPIASMGDSGTSNVKLHFEVRYKGKSVDPLSYLPKL